MSQALVLAPSDAFAFAPSAPAIAPNESGEVPIQRTRYLFGDSTPFPLEKDFIATISDAVDCAVALAKSHDMISRAVELANVADRRCDAEKARLEALAGEVARCAGAAQVTTAERVVRIASRVLETTRVTVAAELAAIEKQRAAESAKAASVLTRAQKDGSAALSAFLAKHDLPGTEVALRLTLKNGEYRAEALVVAPFGVQAVFELDVPEKHAWRRARRVDDLGEEVTINAPQPAGWLGRKTKVLPLRLDRWYVRSAAISMERSVLTLGRGASGGSAIRIDVSRDASQATLRALGEDGEPKGGAFALDPKDSAAVRAMVGRIAAGAGELALRRRTMKSAFADDRSIAEHAAPEAIARRLVQAVAPIVDEIARRSGAPGELVLRRDVRAWRREEIYLTKGELAERVVAVPPALRSVFDPLSLDGSPRVFPPRSPVSSSVDISDADIVEE